MDRPDLSELAAEAREIEDRIIAFKDRLTECRDATLGEYDEETEVETSPGNGDDYNLFESAVSKAAEAGLGLASIVGDLATQVGLREFDAAGIAES